MTVGTPIARIRRSGRPTVFAPGQYQRRERLMREWTDCSNRLMTLQGEEFAAMRMGGSVSASCAERIRVAKAADVEACRAYHSARGHA
jgi:hypothetical protein